MATVRTALADALHALRAIAPGQDPHVDQLLIGLAAAQDLVLAIHNARGPLWDVDITADYTAGEDQRVRIQAGASVNVTLPNSVALYWDYDPYDYNFSGTPLLPPAGSTGAADNIQWRQPRDGSRIEIVGATQALYFYRADTNAWQPASGLTLDSALPLNDRLAGAFAALLAERLGDQVSAEPQPSPWLIKRIQTARAAMFTQTGRHATRRVGEYF